MFWDYFWLIVRNGFLALLLIYILGPERPPNDNEQQQFVALVGQKQFDFLSWEIETLIKKGEADLAAGHIYLDEATRKEVVLEFLRLIQEAGRIEREIELVYTDPAVADPDAESAALQAEDAAVRERLETLQPLAEAIVEEQVSTVLLEEGFGYLGHTWPPVRMHLTPLPALLIVSAREEIRRIGSVPLEAGISTPERYDIETAVRERLDRSGYVTNIGGLGTYPAMIIETPNINFLMEVVAHEWAHHWMGLYPIGLNYTNSAEMRTINESAANILGREVGQEVVRRYYPEYVPAPPPENPPEPITPDPDAPHPFDFRAEMAETRITADRLLAEGDIDEAELYMEARRRFFLDNGYNLRVLNQAYFAFHGAYADQGGATGSDPVGPLVNQVRAKSGTLRMFLDNIRFVTSFSDLQAIAAELQ